MTGWSCEVHPNYSVDSVPWVDALCVARLPQPYWEAKSLSDGMQLEGQQSLKMHPGISHDLIFLVTGLLTLTGTNCQYNRSWTGHLLALAHPSGSTNFPETKKRQPA